MLSSDGEKLEAVTLVLILKCSEIRRHVYQ